MGLSDYSYYVTLSKTTRFQQYYSQSRPWARGSDLTRSSLEMQIPRPGPELPNQTLGDGEAGI